MKRRRPLAGLLTPLTRSLSPRAQKNPATLLLASTPAWTAPDAASRRAICRLGASAMRAASPTSLAPAAACLAARGGVGLLDDGAAGVDALGLVAAAADVLSSEPGQAWLAALHAPERVEAAQLATAAAAAISSPPETVFADAGGDPLGSPADAPAAAAWATRVTACLALASALASGTARPGDAATTTTARAPAPRPTPRPRLASSAGLWSVGDGMGGERAARAGLPTKSASKGLVIEVIGGDDGGGGVSGEEEAGGEKEAVAAAAAATAAVSAAACAATDAAVSVLLAVSLYCEREGLDGAWAVPAAASAALAALTAALGELPPPSTLLLPLALRPLRATLVQAHWTGLDAVRMTMCEGAGVYERVLASRQLAALVRGEAGAATDTTSNMLLPVVLAAADDPAPPVQRGGLTALAHLAAAWPPAALGADRGLLLAAAKKAVVGCDGRAWPAAAGAAVAVVVALDAAAAAKTSTTTTSAAPRSTSTTTIGRPTTAFVPPPPAACLALLSDFLAEGERHAHERLRSLVWLGAAGALLGGCGAGCLALAPRLFPLLLRWLAAPDGAVRERAACALAVLLRSTWPRAPAHAGHVWAHLSAARVGRTGFDEPSAVEVGALVECAAVLWAAGGEGFREEVRGGGGGGEPGGRALVGALGVI